MSAEVLVKRHPAGGWTHAHPVAGRPGAHVYLGQWHTKRGARDALVMLVVLPALRAAA